MSLHRSNWEDPNAQFIMFELQYSIQLKMYNSSLTEDRSTWFNYLGVSLTIIKQREEKTRTRQRSDAVEMWSQQNLKNTDVWIKSPEHFCLDQISYTLLYE